MDTLLEAPNLAGQMDTQKGIVHDIAHAVVGTERGIIFNDGIRSHLHPDTKGIMEAPIDWTPFQDEDGKIDPQKFKTKMADIAATYVAGGVANDLYHDIPFSENPHVGGDLRILKRYMRQVGFTDEEANNTIVQAVLDAAKILSRPGMQHIIEQHAAVREGGLDSKYHVSQNRMEQILRDVKDAQNRSIASVPFFLSGTTDWLYTEDGLRYKCVLLSKAEITALRDELECQRENTSPSNGNDRRHAPSL